MSFIFNILAEYDICSPLLYQHCWEKKVLMNFAEDVLSSRRMQPPVDCLWSVEPSFLGEAIHLWLSFSVVSLYYVILLLIIPLWRHYMYGTWSWHAYSYAFGFVLKTGCDSYAIDVWQNHYRKLGIVQNVFARSKPQCCDVCCNFHDLSFEIISSEIYTFSVILIFEARSRCEAN